MSTIANLTLGMRLKRHEDTLWGVRAEWVVVTAIRKTRDGLLEVELRDGPTLKALLRGTEDTVITLH